MRSRKVQKNLHKPVGVGAMPQRLRRSVYDAPQLKNFRKQIDRQPNDVRTEFHGCLLKLEVFAIPFRSRAELAKRSKLRAGGGKR